MQPVGSVVIVTYNCASYIRECLDSLRGWADRWEVVVADNGSSDDTLGVIAKEFPWVKRVAIGSNIGFSFANNQGAAVTTAPWVLFLNPDTIVTDGALDALIASATRNNQVVLAPRLNNRDGTYQIGSADDRFPTFKSLVLKAILPPSLRPASIRTRGISPGGFDPTKAQAVEIPAGAAILMRREVFDRVGGWDDRFRPVWFEDYDLCKRLIEAGYTIWYEPAAVVIHFGQHTLPMFKMTRMLGMWHANLIRYARKHLPRWQSAILRPILAAGIAFRGLVRAVNPRYTKAAPGLLRLAWLILTDAEESRWYADV